MKKYLFAFLLLSVCVPVKAELYHYREEFTTRDYLMDDKRESKLVYVDCGPLQAGDVLLVTGQFQATNDSGSNVHLASQLRLDVQTGGTGGIDLDPPLTRNVTPNMHHDGRDLTSTYTVTEDMETAIVKLVAWSEQGCGIDDRSSISVIVLR